MIKQISITNFQSHRDSIINFDDGVNIISGASGAGKSAIMRAMLWVIDNRPTGDWIINWGSEKVEVKIVLDNGIVTKYRSNGKSRYEIEDSNGKRILEAFGTQVPNEVKNLFNLSEYNVQTQHSPYLLLGGSPGEVAKRFNELVGLNIIDQLFKIFNKNIATKKQFIEFRNDRIKNIDEELKSLQVVDDIEPLINDIENDNNDYIEFKRKHDNLNDLLTNLSYVKEKLENETSWLKVENEYDNLKKLLESYQNFQYDMIALDEALEKIEDCDSGIKMKTLLLDNLKKSFRKDLLQYKICPLCGNVINDKCIDRIFNEKE